MVTDLPPDRSADGCYLRRSRIRFDRRAQEISARTIRSRETGAALERLIDTEAPILVAVGSTRRPKLDAVRDALDALWPKLSPKLSPISAAPAARFEIVGREVPSACAKRPSAARNRGRRTKSRRSLGANCARRKTRLAIFCRPRRRPRCRRGTVRAERDGSNRRRTVFLSSWAYVTMVWPRRVRQSGAIALPEALAAEVLDNGVSAERAIDAFARERRAGCRGAWGVLTRA